MDQATLVGNQIDDGRKLLDQLRKDRFDVTAASWVKASEDGLWFLYIASKDVDDRGPVAAYKTALSTIRGLPDLWIDPFEVKLVGATNPIALDVLDFQERHPARIPTRFRGARLGNMSIDEAYVYPTVPFS